MCIDRILIFRFAAGFGTTLSQVAGFHRAVPSTALDKACMQLPDDYTSFPVFVKGFRHFLITKFTIPLWTFLVKADKMGSLPSRS